MKNSNVTVEKVDGHHFAPVTKFNAIKISGQNRIFACSKILPQRYLLTIMGKE